jgi:hypothetical protein
MKSNSEEEVMIVVGIELIFISHIPFQREQKKRSKVQ